MPEKFSQACLYRSDKPDELFDRLLSRILEDESAIPVITGPTAAGKSRMAMRLALETGGEIVSVDAMQVYRGFDIGTAKPTPQDRLAVPHHMLDILDPCEGISVATYAEQASGLLGSLLKEQKKPILCGGSVQYLSALLDGLKFIGIKPDPDLRVRMARQVDNRGLEASWHLIQQMDPRSAEAIAPADRRRIIRFFELHQQTGMTKTALNEASRAGGPRFRFLPFWLDLAPRQMLYDRIDRRVHAMLEAGLLDEVKGLMDLYPDFEDCPAFRGIGYREAVSFLKGEISASDCREMTARSTRRYAKRQQTWLRKRKDLNILLLNHDKDRQEAGISP